MGYQICCITVYVIVRVIEVIAIVAFQYAQIRAEPQYGLGEWTWMAVNGTCSILNSEVSRLPHAITTAVASCRCGS